MPCCGDRRAQASLATQVDRAPEPTESTPSQRSLEHDSQPHFQYLGKTGLTVVGPRTQKRYRFSSPGAIVAVDPRDRRALAAVSILRQVRKPTDGAK